MDINLNEKEWATDDGDEMTTKLSKKIKNLIEIC